jgi:uridine kinase
MPPEAASFEEMRLWLAALPSGSAVGIEGFMSSGKSYLAKQLAQFDGIAVVHTDDCKRSIDRALAASRNA